jgi:transcription elongation factor Elf1
MDFTDDHKCITCPNCGSTKVNLLYIKNDYHKEIILGFECMDLKEKFEIEIKQGISYVEMDMYTIEE